MAKLIGKTALAERGDRGTNITINVLLVIFSIAIIYPLWFVIIASFSDPQAISMGKVILWPVDFTLDGYKELVKDTMIWTGYRNTLIYAVIGTLWNLVRLIPAAYALSRKDLPGRKWITLFFMLTMYFSGGMVPKFVLVSNIGWYGNPAAILFTTGISAYNLVLVRSFFMSNVPDSLFDAARIDGCNYTRFFVKVVLPLSGSIIAIMTLFSAQGYWNTYLDAQLYLPEQKYWTLQQVLRNIATATYTASVPEGAILTEEEIRMIEEAARKANLLKYTTVIVASIPMIAIYPLIQRHFVKGIMVGSVKG